MGDEEETIDEKLLLGDSIGQLTPDDWFTRSRASKLVGCSVDTLKRWDKGNIYKASGKMMAGKILVNLYSLEDIENLKQIKLTMKPGKKPKPKLGE